MKHLFLLVGFLIFNTATAFTVEASLLGDAVENTTRQIGGDLGQEAGGAIGGAFGEKGAAIGKSLGGLFGKDIGGALGDRAGRQFDQAFDTIRGGRQGPDGGFDVTGYQDEFNTIGENDSARTYILRILNFVLSFLGIIAVSAIIYAGFTYVTAFGDDSRMESAKKIIIWAAVGIIVVLASFAIVNTIIQQAPSGEDDRGGASSSTGGSTFTTTTGNSTGGTGGFTSTGTGSQKSLLSADQITISGNGITDFGGGVIVSLENAVQGLEIGLTLPAEVIFDFGDGSQGQLDRINNPSQTLRHIFAQEGEYVIRAIYQLSDGSQGTAQKRLIVGGLNPVIQVSKSEALVGEKIQFSAANSSTSIGTLSQFKWTCSGGNGCFPSFQGLGFEAFFGEAGVYTITLTVANNLGVSAQSTQTITVSSDTPIADFTFESTNNTNKPGEFRLNATSSQNIAGLPTGLQYEWTIDGQTLSKTTPILIHEFQNSGSNDVTLKVIQVIRGQRLESETITKTIPVFSTLGVDFSFSQ